MKRPVVIVTLRDPAGTLLHSETRGAFNSGIRASEAAVRELARAQRTTYEGEKPTRVGDVYTRRWYAANGHVVIATIDKKAHGDAARNSRGRFTRR